MQTLKKILEEIDSEIEKQKNADGSLVGTSMWNQWERGMERAKEIIRKHMNDGWIPVEKALPECKSLSCDKYGEIMIGYISDNPEGGYMCEMEGVIMHNVVAWQPLPAPYKPEKKIKTDELTGWKAKMLRTFCKCE